MPTKLDPLISEFATAEEEAAYDLWFRAKVEKAMNSPHPLVPHDEVMAEIDAIIEEEAQKHRAG